MYNISPNKCIGCGICEKLCPKGIEIFERVAKVKKVDHKNTDCLEKALKACPQKAIKDITEELILALGTDDYKVIKFDDHFGMSEHFMIYSCFEGKLSLKEKRNNVKYEEDETKLHGDPGKAKTTSSVLNDVDILIGGMFGPNITRLRNKYVCAVVREQDIEKVQVLIKDNINEIIEEKNKEQRKGLVLR